MNVFFSKKFSLYSLTKVFIVLIVCLLPFTACAKRVNYFDYVSELRKNIFLAETDAYSLRIYSVEKENPYIMDGISKETSLLTEVYFTAAEGDKDCSLSFTVDKREFGGDMSYDNVKAEYYYSCSLDTSVLKQIDCKIFYGEEEIELTAKSVIDEQTLSPKTVLDNLKTEEHELFSSLTDKYGFAGEIYLRLIYEDSAYYYVGVIDQKGNVNAYLINATTGKLLAKRQS